MNPELYICLFLNCKRPQELFGTFNEWITRMQLENSPIKWECFAHIGDIQTFHDPEGYIEHMNTAHESVFVESQVPCLARTNARAETHLFSVCPLCNCPPGKSELTRP